MKLSNYSYICYKITEINQLTKRILISPNKWYLVSKFRLRFGIPSHHAFQQQNMINLTYIGNRYKFKHILINYSQFTVQQASNPQRWNGNYFIHYYFVHQKERIPSWITSLSEPAPPERGSRKYLCHSVIGYSERYSRINFHSCQDSTPRFIHSSFIQWRKSNLSSSVSR